MWFQLSPGSSYIQSSHWYLQKSLSCRKSHLCELIRAVERRGFILARFWPINRYAAAILYYDLSPRWHLLLYVTTSPCFTESSSHWCYLVQRGPVPPVAPSPLADNIWAVIVWSIRGEVITPHISSLYKWGVGSACWIRCTLLCVFRHTFFLISHFATSSFCFFLCSFSVGCWEFGWEEASLKWMYWFRREDFLALVPYTVPAMSWALKQGSA